MEDSMKMHTVLAGDVPIGIESGRLALIAGPCVAEGLDICREIAEAVQKTTSKLNLGYIFKASFDKVAVA